MAKVADLGSKRLVGASPDNWVRWVTQQPDLATQEILTGEFQWVERDTDVLVKVLSPELGEIIVLTEFQLRPDPRMPRRMSAYASLTEERHNCLVYPVVINILPRSETMTIPTRYETECLGLTAHREYRVINLWELDVNLVFQTPLPPLLPFVPILQGGNDETIIRRALSDLRDNEQLAELESLLAFFATFVLESALVRDIMRWDMTVLRESPWYQEILQEGEARGEARGRVEGEAIGEQRAQVAILLKLLSRQLGIDSAIWRQRLESLSGEQLDRLTDDLFDFSNEADLVAWMERGEE